MSKTVYTDGIFRRCFQRWGSHAWRLFLFLSSSVWFGGLTFYALIVIPTAESVLGSEREAGFITQQVTRQLNLIGVILLLILLWNQARILRDTSSRLRRGLWITWFLMVFAQAGLFATHPFLDRVLDSGTHRILSRSAFEMRHLIYLNFTTLQWLAAVAHFSFILRCWRSE